MAAAKRAITDFPANGTPARVGVHVALASGRWQDVESLASVWKERSPAEAIEADVAVARSRIGQGQYSTAFDQLEPYAAAAKTDPDRYAELLTIRATALVKSVRVAEADALLWPLATRSPQWRVRWMRVAIEVPEVAVAEEWLDRIGDVPGTDGVETSVSLANAYDALGERAGIPRLRAKATDAFRQIANNPAVTAAALQAAGAQAERTGDSAAAESLYRRAVAMDPTLAVALNNLANLVAAGGGDLSEAIQFGGQALKLAPRRAAVHDTMAFIQSKAGDHGAAVEHMRVATALEPDNVKWRVRLAQYLSDGGNAREASKAVLAIEERRLEVRGLPAQLRQQLEALRHRVSQTPGKSEGRNGG
jgi:tetratricopeptide (TPR) repeat protein